MGACCDCGGYSVPEIGDAKSIKELSNFLRDKNNEIPIEQLEIDAYLKDKTKIPKKIDINVKFYWYNIFSINPMTILGNEYNILTHIKRLRWKHVTL